MATLAVLLLAAPVAGAATVSGRQTDEYLEVTFAAAPGERNELRVLVHEVGVRFAGSAPLVAGDHCFAVNERDVRCGPPGPVGLVVRARTGDGDDFVFARIAHVALERISLGRGDDHGRGNGLLMGGPGKDDLRVVRGAAGFRGGSGEDVLVGGRFRDGLYGGPGPTSWWAGAASTSSTAAPAATRSLAGTAPTPCSPTAATTWFALPTAITT